MRVKVSIYDDRDCLVQEGALCVGMMREAYEAIDFPLLGADPMIATACCTPEPRRKHIAAMRDTISKSIADEMMKFFEARDTEMGYPRPKSKPAYDLVPSPCPGLAIQVPDYQHQTTGEPEGWILRVMESMVAREEAAILKGVMRLGARKACLALAEHTRRTNEDLLDLTGADLLAIVDKEVSHG